MKSRLFAIAALALILTFGIASGGLYAADSISAYMGFSREVNEALADRIQKELGIDTKAAEGFSDAEQQAIARLCKRVYRALGLSGYARMDLRMTEEGRVYVLEANPNPNLEFGEDLAESAHTAGVSYETLLQRILSLGRSATEKK